jgi:hypothetical protein
VLVLLLDPFILSLGFSISLAIPLGTLKTVSLLGLFPFSLALSAYLVLS